MLTRDQYGILIQTNEDPNYADGGDSAFSTGLMAFSGSFLDRSLMPQFIINNQLVRHPYQTANTGTAPHNDPKATSRDQVIAFFAGLHENPMALPTVNSACLAYAKSWHVNGDALLFANKLYLYKLANLEKPPFWLYPLAYLNQALNVLWDAYVVPNDEKNQSVVMNTVFGPKWITFLMEHHPDLFKTVIEYFSGWRNKVEIGIFLTERIRKDLPYGLPR